MANNLMGMERVQVSGAWVAAGIVGSLIDAAREAAAARARGLAKAKARVKARGRGASEAAEGALWGALVERVKPLLAKRGEKAKLGRELGVSRQQVYAYFNSRTAAPDAERVLRLIVWLAQSEEQAAKAGVAKAVAGSAKPVANGGDRVAKKGG